MYVNVKKLFLHVHVNLHGTCTTLYTYNNVSGAAYITFRFCIVTHIHIHFLHVVHVIGGFQTYGNIVITTVCITISTSNCHYQPWKAGIQLNFQFAILACKINPSRFQYKNHFLFFMPVIKHFCDVWIIINS